MNRDKIRERIRNASIRDPVNAADGPPIYHATRSNGKPLRVAYYRHVKSDHLDNSIYYELETHCARQWISARTDWELKGVFLDTNGSWAAYHCVAIMTMRNIKNATIWHNSQLHDFSCLFVQLINVYGNSGRDSCA